MKTKTIAGLAAAVLLLAGCAASTKSASHTQSTTTATTAASTTAKSTPAKTTPTPSPSVSHDLGSKDASGDVTMCAITVDPTLGFPSAPVTITNHSSKRSNYIITIALESADGATQIDTALVAANDLDPGQSTKQTAQFTTSEKLPAGAKLVLKSVDRLAA